PHFHIIMFTSKDLGSSVLEHVYGQSWQRACRLSGLPIPSDRHGCTVQDGSEAAKYVTKSGSDDEMAKPKRRQWGLEDEMTKAHVKQTRRKGCTPWGLLRAVLDGDDPDYPPERATALFRVYADAFKGRRQLYWSNGLRKRLELGQEVSDEILAERPDDERAYLVGTLSVEDWRAVRRCRAESAVLDAAEGGPESMAAVLDQITDLASRPVPCSDGKPAVSHAQQGRGGVISPDTKPQCHNVTPLSSPNRRSLPGADPGLSVPASPPRIAAASSTHRNLLP
ncbi:hypothetical protein HNR62_003205, partial [Oceanisphaera litoralis]|nr:hypothetical protein [Oceanisphaera litoralis]